MVRTERDKYWIGRILFLRRKIEGFCHDDKNVDRISVLRALDMCLPRSIVREEKENAK